MANITVGKEDSRQEWKNEKQVLEPVPLKEPHSSSDNIRNRITPEYITVLGDNEIFVFGSNAGGRHLGGAARIAVKDFGAIMGQGHGLQGKSYAIDSMSGIAEMQKEINIFCEFAKSHPQMHFLVTPIGCGIAGYSPKEIAPLFNECKMLDNVSLPMAFWEILGCS